MCEHSFTSFVRNVQDEFAVNDLSEDDRFKDISLILGRHSTRFYMSVPIRSPAGYVIGNFCVLDDRPRNVVSDIEWQFMKDMAATVMDYLRTQRALREERRGEKMVKALGLFMEGRASLCEWWLSSRGDDARSEKYNITPDQTMSDYPDKRPVVSSNFHQEATYKKEASETSANAPCPSSTAVRLAEDRREIDVPFRPGADTEQMHKEQTEATDLPSKFGNLRLQDSLVSTDMQLAFGRASNLIREGLEVEGAVFFDVGINATQDTPDFRKPDAQPPESRFGSAQCQTSSSEDECNSQRPQPREKGNEPRERHPDSASGWAREVQTCHVLGYSTTAASSLDVGNTYRHHIHLPETFVKRLLKRYPHGKIFNVDEDGSFSMSDDGSQSNEERDPDPSAEPAAELGQNGNDQTSRKQLELQSILQALPGARSLAFFPLWDFQRARWFAGCLVWSIHPLRTLREEKDLTYLAAFTNSVMSEISRLGMQVADRAKADFISSVSHELRSPLHGILATLEILQATTDVDVAQRNLISTITSCGKTLLDTINHVLDFTKINSLVRPRRRDKAGRYLNPSEMSPLGVPDLINDVDVSCLVQEVVDGMLAGQNYSDSCPPQASRVLNDREKKQVVVVLDIDREDSWLCSVSSGAWRRVVMNLVSNSLKYTNCGYVQVALRYRAATAATSNVPRPAICLSVKDSGRGMSKEFLRHHLYTPFVQEDPLSVGTGLGLSIVRKIVDSLGGHIRFHSEQDYGTEVEVILPFAQSTLSCRASAYRGLRDRLNGMTVRLFASDRPFCSRTLKVVHLSLSRLATDWFGLRVTTAVDWEKEGPDILIISENEFRQGLPLSWTARLSTRPILLCTDVCSRPVMEGNVQDFILLHQP
jgi:signal transduction histidine kinase